MFNAVVINNLGKTVAKAPVCMTLEMAMDFAEASALDYRRENACHYWNHTTYPYCRISITAGNCEWEKRFPVSSILDHSEC